MSGTCTLPTLEAGDRLPSGLCVTSKECCWVGFRPREGKATRVEVAWEDGAGSRGRYLPGGVGRDPCRVLLALCLPLAHLGFLHTLVLCDPLLSLEGLSSTIFRRLFQFQWNSCISALLQEIVLSNPARTFLFICWALEMVRLLHLDVPLAEMGPFLRGGIQRRWGRVLWL